MIMVQPGQFYLSVECCEMGKKEHVERNVIIAGSRKKENESVKSIY
ncbi:MAG: hypothetical protein ACOX4L_03260 [Bacillota bacterium]